MSQAPARRAALLPLGALFTLFLLTLRQHARGKRLLVLVLLFLLPTGLALVARAVDPPPPTDDLEQALLLTFLPQGLIPLAALLLASGMIQDEIEDQTLTYLLMRPIPRWALYLAKLLATWLMAGVLVGVFTLVAAVVVYWGEPGWLQTVLAGTGGKLVLIQMLSVAAYCTLFGAVSLFTRRTLLLGIAYIVLFEGLLANMDFMIRRLTVVYYYRVLVERWAGRVVGSWAMPLAGLPTALGCVQILGLASVLLAVWGAWAFTHNEFRLKTPEGS